MMSGEQKVTVSAIKLVLHILKAKVLKISEGADLTETIKQQVLDYLLKKYDDTDIDKLINVHNYAP